MRIIERDRVGRRTGFTVPEGPDGTSEGVGQTQNGR